MNTHMPDSPRVRLPRLRRLHVDGKGRSRPVSTILLLGILLLTLFLLYLIMFDRPAEVSSRVIDLSKSLQMVQELSTVRSHLRFGVVVQEKSGNIIVRRLADQAEYIGMEDLSSALFQNPTMIAELHGIATYGVRLDGLQDRIRQTDSSVVIPLPRAELLDVKLVAADTRIVAQMKGLFRRSNNDLLLEAQRQGETFTRQFAENDTALQALAGQRARDALALLLQNSGKKAVFE